MRLNRQLHHQRSMWSLTRSKSHTFISQRVVSFWRSSYQTWPRSSARRPRKISVVQCFTRGSSGTFHFSPNIDRKNLSMTHWMRTISVTKSRWSSPIAYSAASQAASEKSDCELTPISLLPRKSHFVKPGFEICSKRTNRKMNKSDTFDNFLQLWATLRFLSISLRYPTSSIVHKHKFVIA